MNYGSKSVTPEERKRNISIEEYFQMPRVTMNGSRRSTMQEGLTKTLAMHSAAVQFGIVGLTKSLVTTNSKIKTFIYTDVEKRALEKLSVSIKGKNNSSITCVQSVPEAARLNGAGSLENMEEYITVSNGEIVNPTSLWTYTCTLTGKIQDMGPALHKVLKEVYALNVRNYVAYEKDSQTLGFDIAYQNYIEKSQALEKFMDMGIPGIGARNFLGMSPINKTIVNEVDYSARPALALDQTLNAKAYGLLGSQNCNANLICTKDSCDFMTNEETEKASEVLSVIE